jgi:hypothetical protein
MVHRPASMARKALSGGGTMDKLLELCSRALWCRVLCDVSSYGRGVQRETHLWGFSVAGATGGWCAMVTAFPWASVSAGVRSCCPLGTEQGWAVAMRSPLARHQVKSLRGGL